MIEAILWYKIIKFIKIPLYDHLGWSFFSWEESCRGFKHSLQLQWGPQATPALKHSQYFFWQLDFLQLHLIYPARNRFLRRFLALNIPSLFSATLQQLKHEQSSEQSFPFAKHSQYNFKHAVFLHTHPFFFFLEGVWTYYWVIIGTGLWLGSSCWNRSKEILFYSWKIGWSSISMCSMDFMEFIEFLESTTNIYGLSRLFLLKEMSSNEGIQLKEYFFMFYSLLNFIYLDSYQ